MYDHIFARSFSKNEQKRFGNCAFVICIFVAFALCTIFRPSFHLSILNMEVSTSRDVDMVILDTSQVESQISRKDEKMIIEPLRASSHASHIDSNSSETGHSGNLSLSVLSYINHTSRFSKSGRLRQPTRVPTLGSRNDTSKDPGELQYSIDIGTKETILTCNSSTQSSNTCQMKGDIRIHGNSSTIFIVTSQVKYASWSLKPYARNSDKNAMKGITNFTIKSIPAEQEKTIQNCMQTHNVPAVVFSVGGYSGNNFHAFSDVIIPLYETTREFDRQVQFLITNKRSKWTTRFEVILHKLSSYKIIDIDHENKVHCFPRMIVGLKKDTRKELHTSSMKNFTSFLRDSYSLERSKAIKPINTSTNKPRLLIVSREKTRVFTNVEDIVRVARESGFEVIVTEMSGNLTRASRLVNSCDVMMGVHGAGLTNMVFLPENGMLIQVVPWGTNWVSRNSFGEPSKAMGLNYLEYRISEEESTLIDQYPLNHQVFMDPHSIARNGWQDFKSIYLDRQNVKLDASRFKQTLSKALELL